MPRIIWSAVLAIFALFAVAGPTQAQYPEKPVTIVVAFAAGGTTDTAARLFAEELTKRTGQQFLVENLPGANGTIGTANVAAAAPDGYRLVVGSPNSMVQNPYLMGDVGYTTQSFVPIARMAALDIIIVTRPGLGVTTIKDLIQYSKDHPGTVNFGSAGVGNNAHQAGELMKLRTGADITHIPYQGGALATAALLAGEVDVLFNTPTEVLPYIASGEILPLAVMSPERIPFVPDVPTLNESGIEGMNLVSWIGLFAPAGTPTEVIDYLNGQMSAIIADPAVRDRLLSLGLRPSDATAADLAAELAAEAPTQIELIDLVGGPQKK